MFEVTDQGDVFTHAHIYDLLVGTCTLGAVSRAYRRAATIVAGDRPARVLDVGTGTGAMAIALKERVPAAEVHALDASERMLDVARTNGVRRGVVVHFCHGWAQDLPFADDEFDAVTFAAALHHIPATQRGGAMAEARRVLRPGGMALVVEYVPVGPVRVLPTHREAMDLDGCRRLLRASGFDDVGVGRVSPLLFGYAAGRLPPLRARMHL